MYSKQVLNSAISFKKQNLTFQVCLRYLHKHTSCSSDYLDTNYKKNTRCQLNMQYVGHRKINLTQNYGKQYVGIFQKIPKQLVNYQPSRSYGDVAPELKLDIPLEHYTPFFKVLIDSPPILYCQESLIALHSAIGLPWWATIVLTTIVARTFVTLPLTLYQQYIFAKLTLIKYEMDDIVKDLKLQATAAVRYYNWEEAFTRSIYNQTVREEYKKLVIKENCHPLKAFIVLLLQIPMWVILSASLRNLSCMLPHPTPAGIQAFQQLSVEGFGWISNLTATDPWWILPVLSATCHLINLECLNALRQAEPSKIQKIGDYLARGVILIFVPISGLVPTSMTLYWTTSSVYGIFQTLVIYSPRVRRFVRIPETELELDHPYKHLHARLKKKFLSNNKENKI
ncbi:cytochrome c oxidase assembly protein COX18, mitochondrial [Chelonus insularis]|uniref:cytochrome c oxidase assembly protein COX18, mitochondrial n=1 Tax=Chelonus insularis TaxID=460826 RepID=UPI00158EA7D5|nr:cytochrome c oxidase assembly protein COX18, mitochondrial [Chelonus insularis]